MLLQIPVDIRYSLLKNWNEKNLQEHFKSKNLCYLLISILLKVHCIVYVYISTPFKTG